MMMKNYSSFFFFLSLIFLPLLLSTPVEAKVYLNRAYGTHKRQIFDLWVPEKIKKAPLVIFIHPGGWYKGSKEEVKKHSGIIKDFNDAGIALASINYRFLNKASLQTIMREDIAGFVQFIRHHARKFNIDKRRVLSFGESAGGSASLWLATHDDLGDPKSEDPVKKESTRILAAGHINAQFSYDFLDWYQFFEHDKIDQFVGSQLWTRYHFKSVEDLHTTNGKKIREGLDMYENLTPDDAPTFFYNSYPNLSSQTRDHLFHSPIHAKILHEKAKKIGVRSILKLDGDNPVNQNPYEEIKKFFIQEISRSKNNILWSIFQL
jgi:hypothetical protein